MMLALLTNLPRETLVQQINDGLILLVLGMGTVFIFLVLLIYATKIMSKVCSRISPAEKAEVKSVQRPVAATAPKTVAKSNDAAIAAAIAAAYDKER